MQKIEIQKLKVPTLIGVYDWERKALTNLLMTLEIWADLSAAMHSDAVADTIDYGKVTEAVKQVAAASSFELLEALGQALANHLLTSYPINKLVLCIEKPDILPDAQTVSVTMAFDKQGIIGV